MTRYQLHVRKWQDCTRCHLHENRSQVVMARGSLPCDVFFVGEAPGETEDTLGEPFSGPSGVLLDQIITMAFEDHPTLTTAFGNLVGCIPRDETGNKTKEPDEEAILKCRSKITELSEMAQPRLTVLVGKMAEEWTDPVYKHTIKLYESPRVRILHPGKILKSHYIHQSQMIQENIEKLAKALRTVFCSDPIPF